MKRVPPLIVPTAGAFGQGRKGEMSPILWGVMVGWWGANSLRIRASIMKYIISSKVITREAQKEENLAKTEVSKYVIRVNAILMSKRKNEWMKTWRKTGYG